MSQISEPNFCFVYHCHFVNHYYYHMHHRPVAYHTTRFGSHAYQKQLNYPCHVIFFCPVNYSYPIGIVSWMTEPATHCDPVPAHCRCRHGHHGDNQLTYQLTCQLTWGKPWNLTPPTCLPQLLTRYSKSSIFEFFAPTKCPVLHIVLVHIVPDVKEAAYKRTGAACLGIWKLSLGHSHSWPPGRTGKGPKSCGKVCDGKLCFLKLGA